MHKAKILWTRPKSFEHAISVPNAAGGQGDTPGPPVDPGQALMGKEGVKLYSSLNETLAN